MTTPPDLNTKHAVAPVADQLVQAMQSGRLFKACSDLSQTAQDPQDAALIDQAQAACTTITTQTMATQTRLIDRLTAAGLTANAPFPLHPDSGLQYHEFSLDISADQLGAVLDIVAAEGFAVDDVLRRKWKAVSRASTGVYLMAWDAVSTRMFLRWKPAKSGLLDKLRPVPADYAAAPIPQALWPLYFAVKPLRMVAEKLTGQRTADRLGLKSGSFSLGTPHVLLDPLFDEIALTRDDMIADLGCGDGRILIAAAKRSGCRALGVEQNAALVVEANRDAQAQGVGGLVKVTQGSALEFPLNQASVIFLFLPKALLPVILTAARKSAKPGTRILAHEQHALHTDWPPSRRVPVIAQNAMTVAHIWKVEAT